MKRAAGYNLVNEWRWERRRFTLARVCGGAAIYGPSGSPEAYAYTLAICWKGKDVGRYFVLLERWQAIRGPSTMLHRSNVHNDLFAL